MSDPGNFLAEDYRFTAELLRRYTEMGRTDKHPAGAASLFRAVCSNNLNIILAALDVAEKHAQQMEETDGNG